MRLQLVNVRKSFHNCDALTDVSFQADEPEFISVIGSSGAGKTTLFRILNGELLPDAGQVLYDGADLAALKGSRKRQVQQKIGTVYQDYCLVEPSTCLQNVLHAALPDMGFMRGVLGIFGKERTARAEELLRKVGLQDKIHEPVKHLSGGQKQRVAIARAMMRQGDFILADEPASSLDPVTGRQIVSLLRQLQKDYRITVLMNSHNLAFSLDFSDRIIGLRSGRVIYDGPAAGVDEEILRNIYGEEYDTLRRHEADAAQGDNAV